jgi:4-hydroxy-tetrahydrodipicolinate synthase
VLLKGLCAFPITPADASGQVDVSAPRRLVARLCEVGVDSIGPLGSTGSYPYFSCAERRRALDAALEAAAGRAPILEGVERLGLMRPCGFHRTLRWRVPQWVCSPCVLHATNRR